MWVIEKEGSSHEMYLHPFFYRKDIGNIVVHIEKLKRIH
jgi:hypothetical protein